MIGIRLLQWHPATLLPRKDAKIRRNDCSRLALERAPVAAQIDLARCRGILEVGGHGRQDTVHPVLSHFLPSLEAGRQFLWTGGSKTLCCVVLESLWDQSKR